MKDRANGAQGVRIFIKEIEKCIGLQEIVEAERGKVFPFRIPAKDIGYKDVILTPKIQAMDVSTADKSGTACDKDGGLHV